MSINAANESILCRLLIPRRSGSELLLLTEQHGLALPSVDVPQLQRIAPHLTAQLKDRWGIETVCLFAPTLSPLPSGSVRYQIAELCRPNGAPPEGCSWFPLASLSEASFGDPEELGRVRSAMGEFERYANGSLRGTFAKAGWLREVFAWVDAALAARGLQTTGQFRQLNASPTFSLLRVETTGPAFWFKAVGKPNLREYPITLRLAKSFPTFLPTVVANRKDWNAWLATEAPGSHPDVRSNLRAWLTIATSLADLQVASLGQALHLVDAGCRDLRVRSLRDQVHPFLEAMAELMDEQTKETPARLSRSELQLLGAQLHEALSTFDDSRIPNALGHLDFNPGNIVVSEDSCVFLDWAEACVGHPFLTFQYLLEHRRRSHGADADREAWLVSAYLNPWRSFASAREISSDFQFTPLLALFAYAAGGSVWRSPEILRDHQAGGYLRSLVRRMKREAEALPKPSAPCVL